MQDLNTSHLGEHNLSAEMYFEEYHDKIIRRDLTVTDEEIVELCSQMKKVAIANVNSGSQKEAIKDITKNVLLSWGLLEKAEDGSIHPTNEYVFLLGKDKSVSHIQCGMFKGKTRAVFVDKREYSGPLWQQIDDSFQFVLRNIHLGAKLEGIYRKDIYELPPDSIRELIINAVMNCSYLQSSHIQVAIYDDRLEITSPGGLMPGVTLDKMREGYSKIRNRALAHAFSYMNLIEAWGSGILKLLEAMKEYGLREPEFQDLEIGFRINLYRNTEDTVIRCAEENIQSGTQATQGNTQATQSTTQTVHDTTQTARDTTQTTQDTTQTTTQTKLSQEAKTVLQIISQNPDMTQKEIAEKLGWKINRVKYHVNRMRQQNIIKRVGTSHKGHWEVV